MEFAESISVEEIEQLELASFDGPIIVVDQINEDYAEAVDYLCAQSVIGFDTETKPCFQANQPRNKMALLQLAGPEKVYLFRLHAVGLPKPVAAILADPNIVKVGAAVKDDIRGLQKYTKFTPKNFVDLQIIGADYGIQDKSVKKMAAIIMGVKVSKAQQLSNWEAPVLSGPQLKYAAIDAWICREMYLKLKNSR
ncbi:MAG: 3'-5' exonuclease domain-containing protein 2 [Bacteroidales bacterium]|nr:3'-5' exonuclease domain-containing protein 2 [Bacteroidales bacterium]